MGAFQTTEIPQMAKSRNSTRANSSRTSHEVPRAPDPQQLQEQYRNQVGQWSTTAAGLARASEVMCQLQLNSARRMSQRLQEFSARIAQSRNPQETGAA